MVYDNLFFIIGLQNAIKVTKKLEFFTSITKSLYTFSDICNLKYSVDIRC